VDGLNRYRLFFNQPFKVEPGHKYIATGVYTQKRPMMPSAIPTRAKTAIHFSQAASILDLLDEPRPSEVWLADLALAERIGGSQRHESSTIANSPLIP
jgi:hypothetical protein